MLQLSSTGSRTRTSRFVDNYIASTTIDSTRKSFCSTTFSSFQPYLPIISFWCFKQMLQQQNPLLIKLDLIHCHLFWVGTAAFLSDFIFNCLFVILSLCTPTGLYLTVPTCSHLSFIFPTYIILFMHAECLSLLLYILLLVHSGYTL